MTARAVIANFRSEHPEWEHGFRQDAKLGLVMSDACSNAFVAWCVEKGYTTPEHAKRLRRAQDRAVRQMHYEDN